MCKGSATEEALCLSRVPLSTVSLMVTLGVEDVLTRLIRVLEETLVGIFDLPAFLPVVFTFPDIPQFQHHPTLQSL